MSQQVFVLYVCVCTQQTEDEDKNEVIEEDQVLMVISHNELEDMVMSHKTVTNQSVSHDYIII